jgi:hypothetical protein
MNSWTFRPDIGLPNIRAKLPEKAFNIEISGQNDLIINVELNRFGRAFW